MTRWRHLADQIGGRNAISIWSWIITIPLTILVSSTYAGRPTFAEVLTWQSVVLAVHALLGVVMWVAAKTILPDRDRASHPLVALAFFGFLGLTRGILLQLAQDTIGISGGVFSERLAVNIVGSMVALAAIAIVVDDYRTDDAIIQRLEQARASLARLRDQQEEMLRAADIDVLEQVHQRIETELASAGADPERVKSIVDDIVRPLSHELAGSAPLRLAVPMEEQAPRARLTFSGAFGRMTAPPPLAVTIIVEATILGAVIVRFGSSVALVNALLGGGLVLGGCWLVKRFVPLPRAPLGRLAVLGASLGLVGALATVITTQLVRDLRPTLPEGVIGVAGGVVGAGLALSLWAAVNEGRKARQEEMAQAVGEQAAEVERLASSIEARRLQAARFLHGPIQGDLVAAALRRDSPADIRRSITQRFSAYDEASERSPDDQARTVLEAWSTVLEIEYDCDVAVWRSLAGHALRSALLIDALSEGLTNVVRHASSRRVDVTLEAIDLSVRLRVRSQGRAAFSRDPGMGLEQLRARGAQVSLETGPGFTELCVVF